jgi:hypothetical protein
LKILSFHSNPIVLSIPGDQLYHFLMMEADPLPKMLENHSPLTWLTALENMNIKFTFTLSGRGILLDLLSATETRVAFWYSRKLLWPKHDGSGWHCAGYHLTHFSGNHAHLYVGIAPYHVMYSKTSSSLVYQMELNTGNECNLSNT